jgi:hypothetical protein
MLRSIIALLAVVSLAIAAPVPAEGGNAYTGNGGSAVGGSYSKSS